MSLVVALLRFVVFVVVISHTGTDIVVNHCNCLCLQCFACSVELGSHKKTHDYQIFVSTIAKLMVCCEL